MLTPFRLLLALLSATTLLGGCANLHSIYREESVGDYKEHAEIQFVDAKQRAVMSTQRHGLARGADGKPYIETYRTFCAEPSPDVFSVLSQAMSASGSFGQGADPEQVSAALQAAFSSAEAGSTIPRTQTVTMLRELMYRTCERYLSGALSDLEFSTQAIRDQRIMVSILAIEQLTGAVTPRAVGLSAGGTANAGFNTTDAITRYDDARKELVAADKALQSANDDKKAAEELEPKAPRTCKAISDDVKANPEGAPVAAEKAKYEKCSTADKKIAENTKRRKEAQDHYDTLTELAGNGGAAGTTSTATAPSTTGGIDQAESVAEVADAVVQIVESTFNQDEYLLFCLKEMDQGANPTLTTDCSAYAKALLDYKTELLKRSTQEVALDTKKLRTEVLALEVGTMSQFDRFWLKVASAGDANVADNAKLSTLINNYIQTKNPGPRSTRLLRDMAAKASKDAIKNDFRLLLGNIREGLAS